MAVSHLKPEKVEIPLIARRLRPGAPLCFVYKDSGKVAANVTLAAVVESPDGKTFLLSYRPDGRLKVPLVMTFSPRGT